MDNNSLMFQLGKLSTARIIIEQVSRRMNGHPEIWKLILDSYYKLNEATNKMDELVDK